MLTVLATPNDMMSLMGYRLAPVTTEDVFAVVQEELEEENILFLVVTTAEWCEEYDCLCAFHA